MAQRLVNIFLPKSHGKEAQELLKSQESLSFWQEESAGGNFVIRRRRGGRILNINYSYQTVNN